MHESHSGHVHVQVTSTAVLVGAQGGKGESQWPRTCTGHFHQEQAALGTGHQRRHSGHVHVQVTSTPVLGEAASVTVMVTVATYMYRSLPLEDHRHSRERIGGHSGHVHVQVTSTAADRSPLSWTLYAAFRET